MSPEYNVSIAPPETQCIIELPGDSIVLKRLGVEDAQVLFDLFKVSRNHLLPFCADIVENHDTIEKVVEDITSPEKDPNTSQFGILDNEDLVGKIRLTVVENGGGEIGYLVGRPYVGRGYAARAVEALSQHAFGTLRLVRLTAQIDSANIHSQNTIERAGFRLYSEYGHMWAYERLNPLITARFYT